VEQTLLFVFCIFIFLLIVKNFFTSAKIHPGVAGDAILQKPGQQVCRKTLAHSYFFCVIYQFVG
jgi:hypothetical protein